MALVSLPRILEKLIKDTDYITSPVFIEHDLPNLLQLVAPDFLSVPWCSEIYYILDNAPVEITIKGGKIIFKRAHHQRQLEKNEFISGLSSFVEYYRDLLEMEPKKVGHYSSKRLSCFLELYMLQSGRSPEEARELLNLIQGMYLHALELNIDLISEPSPGDIVDMIYDHPVHYYHAPFYSPIHCEAGLLQDIALARSAAKLVELSSDMQNRLRDSEANLSSYYYADPFYALGILIDINADPIMRKNLWTLFTGNIPDGEIRMEEIMPFIVDYYEHDIPILYICASANMRKYTALDDNTKLTRPMVFQSMHHILSSLYAHDDSFAKKVSTTLHFASAIQKSIPIRGQHRDVDGASSPESAAAFISDHITYLAEREAVIAYAMNLLTGGIGSEDQAERLSMLLQRNLSCLDTLPEGVLQGKIQGYWPALSPQQERILAAVLKKHALMYSLGLSDPSAIGSNDVCGGALLYDELIKQTLTPAFLSELPPDAFGKGREGIRQFLLDYVSDHKESNLPAALPSSSRRVPVISKNPIYAVKIPLLGEVQFEAIVKLFPLGKDQGVRFLRDQVMGHILGELGLFDAAHYAGYIVKRTHGGAKRLIQVTSTEDLQASLYDASALYGLSVMRTLNGWPIRDAMKIALQDGRFNQTAASKVIGKVMEKLAALHNHSPQIDERVIAAGTKIPTYNFMDMLDASFFSRLYSRDTVRLRRAFERELAGEKYTGDKIWGHGDFTTANLLLTGAYDDPDDCLLYDLCLCSKMPREWDLALFVLSLVGDPELKLTPYLEQIEKMVFSSYEKYTDCHPDSREFQRAKAAYGLRRTGTGLDRARKYPGNGFAEFTRLHYQLALDALEQIGAHQTIEEATRLMEQARPLPPNHAYSPDLLQAGAVCL